MSGWRLRHPPRPISEVASSTPSARGQLGKQIDLDNVSYGYGALPVLTDLSLSIRPSEFFTLLGESGCGKTTTLRLVAGLLHPTKGSVRFDGVDVTRVPVHKRGISMVFQNYALMPHLRILDNVAYGLRHSRLTKQDRIREANLALDRVGLSGFGERFPSALSGGQQQRVGLARAVAVRSGIMLLDEPLSNLDSSLRQQMCKEIRDLQQELQVTILYVTHDRTEALTMSDRVAVMTHGNILETGPPRNLYEMPTHLQSARLLGDINELVVSPNDHGGFVTPDGSVLRVSRPSIVSRDNRVTLGVRPERVQVVVERTSELKATSNSLAGVLTHIQYIGSYLQLTVRCAGLDTSVIARHPDATLPHVRPGDPVYATWPIADTILFRRPAP